MPFLNQANLSDRKKEEIYINGRYMEVFTAYDATTETSERNAPVIGRNENLREIRLTGGTLTLTAYTDKGQAAAQAVMMGIDPDAVKSDVFFVTDDEKTQDLIVFVNRRSDDDQHYVGATWFGSWDPLPLGDEQGGTEDEFSMQFAGGTDARLDVHGDDGTNGLYIATKLVTLNSGTGIGGDYVYSGTIGELPYKPTGFDAYALGIQLRSGSASDTPLYQNLEFEQGMVSGTSQGHVLLTTKQVEQFKDKLGQPSELKAVVYYFKTGSGTRLTGDVTFESIYD